MTFIAAAALITALLSLAYAYLTRRKLDDIGQRLSRAASNNYQLSSQVEELTSRLEQQDKELRFEIKQAAGQIHFGPETTISQIQTEHPLGQQILASFHMGGCHSCAVEPSETIAQATTRLGIDQTALLMTLRNGQNGGTVRTPNVELQF